ncbi:MAG TPA: T9SS type A sorting domain-containing protein [Rubricoccaceae bacterium]|jgi:hypothetical protein
MKRLLALALALGVALPASAQVDPARAFPLSVGNRWEFGGGALRWDVVGEQTVGSERIALLQFDGGPTCGVRTSADPLGRSALYRLVDVADPEAVCPFTTVAVRYPWFNESPDGREGAFGVGNTPRMAQVTIGDTTLVGPLWGSVVPSGIGVRQVDAYDVFDGIGVVRFDRWSTYGGGTQMIYLFRYELSYARIDGVEYGVRAVAGEESAQGAGALALAAGPNPARTATTLRYALPAGVRGQIAVVDALGREVRRLDAEAGTTEVGLDVRGLAPGVYVVRLAAGRASTAVRLVVTR